jgi:iron complex outermembrane receptor protein
VEADLNGKVGQHLRLTAAAALQRVEVVHDTALPAGDRLVGAPGWTFNLFGVYELGGALDGLELGGGFHATGPTESTQPNTSFKLPETRQLDAVAAWRLSEQARLQVNLYNLGDQQSFVSKQDALGYRMVRTAQPRSAYVQLQLQF